MKVVLFETDTGSPDSKEWHDWRSQGFGGSDAPVIGVWRKLNSKATWMKPTAFLWMIKSGQLVLPNISNWATERGRAGEEGARLAFEEKTGILLQPMFGEMDDYSFIRSSFDGVSLFMDVIGEIKCPSPALHEKARNGEIPDYYFTQMLHQGLTIWGPPSKGQWFGKRMFYISYIPELGDLVWVEVPCDDFVVQDKADLLLEAEIDFWHHVVTKTDPAGEAWKSAAEAYVAAELELEMAKVTLESCKTNLEFLLGDNLDGEGSGITVSRSKRAGSIKYREAVDVLMHWYGIEPERFLERFRGEETEFLSVRVKKEGKRRKVKADGGLSLDAARSELARISAQEAKPQQKAYAW